MSPHLADDEWQEIAPLAAARMRRSDELLDRLSDIVDGTAPPPRAGKRELVEIMLGQCFVDQVTARKPSVERAARALFTSSTRTFSGTLAWVTSETGIATATSATGCAAGDAAAWNA